MSSFNGVKLFLKISRRIHKKIAGGGCDDCGFEIFDGDTLIDYIFFDSQMDGWLVIVKCLVSPCSGFHDLLMIGLLVPR